MRVIYLLTTDRQTVNYYLTIHALKLVYFDSNIQETMKKKIILQILPTFRHCTEEIMRENDVAQSNVKDKTCDDAGK